MSNSEIQTILQRLSHFRTNKLGFSLNLLSGTGPRYSLLADAFCHPQQMTRLSSNMFGDNIYVGNVLKVPPVSYFYI